MVIAILESVAWPSGYIMLHKLQTKICFVVYV